MRSYRAPLHRKIRGGSRSSTFRGSRGSNVTAATGAPGPESTAAPATSTASPASSAAVTPAVAPPEDIVAVVMIGAAAPVVKLGAALIHSVPVVAAAEARARQAVEERAAPSPVHAVNRPFQGGSGGGGGRGGAGGAGDVRISAVWGDGRVGGGAG